MAKSNYLLDSYEDKISNPCQVGGIELSELRGGPGDGVRIAWFNTGSGLRFKVVIDRGMDIADAFMNQFGLAWISHLGIAAPGLYAQHGDSWLYGLGGGLLVTCGLDQVGPASDGPSGSLPLHGRIGMLPAVLESVVQPDPLRGEYGMSICGRTLQTTALGHHLEIRRTISATLGAAKISVRDSVTNLGNRSAPHMLLYHCNFGYPLVDDGTRIIWKGRWVSRGGPGDDFIFNEANVAGFRRCLPPIPEHDGDGEAVAFIDVDADRRGNCECGLFNDNIGLGVKLKFKKGQLPWLTNWQHFGKNEYVVGLEPGTHPPIGCERARQEGTMLCIEPGETRSYQLDMEILLDD